MKRSEANSSVKELNLGLEMNWSGAVADSEQGVVFRPYLGPQTSNWARSSGILKLTSKATILLQSENPKGTILIAKTVEERYLRN